MYYCPEFDGREIKKIRNIKMCGRLAQFKAGYVRDQDVSRLF